MISRGAAFASSEFVVTDETQQAMVDCSSLTTQC